MKMSDKELDRLFNSNLGDMEVEPSARVWEQIKMEVSGEEASGKKSMMPYLQIAASIIVLIGVALFFRPQTEKIALHGNFDAAALNTNIAPGTIALKAAPLTVYTQQPQVTRGTKAGEKQHSKTGHVETPGVIAIVAPIDTTQNIASARMPDRVPVEIQSPVTHTTIPAAKPADPALPPKVLTASNTEAPKEEPTLKKKKIRSIGDLFNVMIAKVDKRPNKIIQFENNDEDDGDFGVAGVNLGPIQIKKND